MGRLLLLLALAAPPPARPLRAIVMRESLAAPFVHSNELGDRQASPLWELSGGARVWEHFVRLTGGAARRGALWSRVPLGEVAVVGELALRVQGEGAAPVDPARAAGLALWVARRPEDAPSLEAAFRAAPLVDDARVVPDAAAVGVVLSAGAARVVVRDDRGVVGVAGSCRCDLRTRTAPGADLARATRTVRLEVVAGAPLLENGEAFPQPGFARLTVVAARRPGQRRAATLCDFRVDLDALHDRAWMRAARLGLAAAAPAPDPADAPGDGLRPPDRQDVLALTLRRQAASDADRDPVAPGYARHSAAVDPERADALERGVDAVLHGIEDVEASYEHELIAVRDDLRRTLAELIAARTSAARRLAALEARATAAATSDLDRRVARLEGLVARGTDAKYRALDRKLAGAARRAAQTSLARRWRLWRPAFLSFVVVFAVWAAKMRGFYKWVKRTHML